MDIIEQFHKAIDDAMAVPLATAAGESVTMRAVSPVNYNGGVLMFTYPDSVKYVQLKANPLCCIGAAHSTPTEGVPTVPFNMEF